MKLLVLGHSNSDGTALPDANDAWPCLTQGLLKEAGVECELTQRRIFAGPSAAAMLQREVQRAQPDVVVLCTSTYGVVVRLISAQVRDRWGERAGRIVKRLEDYGFQRRHRLRSRPARAVFRRGSKAIRRVIGTKTLHSVDQLAGWYEDCFRALAQFEEVQGIILTGVGYGPAVDRLNPGWQEPQEKVYSRLRQTAARHRFAWVQHDDLLGGPIGKLKHFYNDGVHTDEESHRIAAAAIVPIILNHSH